MRVIRQYQQIPILHVVILTEDQVAEELLQIDFILIDAPLDVGIVRADKGVSEIP